MFKRVDYELSVAMFNTIRVQIWVEDDKLHYSKNVLKRPSEKVKDEISSVSVEEFSKKIEVLRIGTWKKSYQPQEYAVMDGESWTVKYEDIDGIKAKSSGDNAYPSNWKAFQKLLSGVVGNIDIDQ